LAIEKFDPDEINWLWEGTIIGEAVSKENSRRLVSNPKTGKLIPIKSKKALAFVKAFEQQCPVLDPLLEGDLTIAMEIFYGSRRPDLDESLILDCMQGKIYLNDRQVKERHTYWGLDRKEPKITIRAAHRIEKRTKIVLPWDKKNI
jgi:hypothetical protein